MLIQRPLVLVLVCLLGFSAVSADPTSALRIRLDLKMNYTTDQSQSARSTTILANLVVGTEKTYGEQFPKLELVALADPRDGDTIEVRIVGEDGSVLTSSVVYLPPDSGAEFALEAPRLNASGTISRL